MNNHHLYYQLVLRYKLANNQELEISKFINTGMNYFRTRDFLHMFLCTFMQNDINQFGIENLDKINIDNNIYYINLNCEREFLKGYIFADYKYNEILVLNYSKNCTKNDFEVLDSDAVDDCNLDFDTVFKGMMNTVEKYKNLKSILYTTEINYKIVKP